MDYLYQKLPQDLANIVEEYAKDRTNYDKVMFELRHVVIHGTPYFFVTDRKIYWHILNYINRMKKELILYNKRYRHKNKLKDLRHNQFKDGLFISKIT